jgi:hypothetical protein
VVENKILEDLSSEYGSFNTIGYKRKPERYDFANQMRVVMRRA